MGNAEHGVTEVQHQHPYPKIDCGNVRRIRNEDFVDGYHDNGYGQRNPVFVLPPSTAISVNDDAHDGVGHQIPDACQREDQADSRETKPQAPAVEWRQIDGNRHGHGPYGQRDH